MAQFPPIKGSLYCYASSIFKIKEVSADNIVLVKVDNDGNELGAPISINKKKWESRDYIAVESADEMLINDSKIQESENSRYRFEFDPKTGEIIVLCSDGSVVARLNSIRGETGLSLFEEWCTRSGKDKHSGKAWAEFLETMRGENGHTVNGHDALSPYEEWLNHLPKEATAEQKSYSAFLRSIAGAPGKDGYEGKDGKDGLSAFEVWKSIQPNGDKLTEKDFFDFLKGETGKNGHEGVDGKNGDTWKPYVSDDGILYFENTRTGERTEPVNIKGFQGPGADKGASGDTWEPYFPDDGKHQLYFKNQKGEILGPFDVVGATGKTGPQGPRGESAYQIWKNEGHDGDFHDFLLWIAEQAQKGEDGKDGDTFRPHVEKGGHLFFISTKTGERIDGGWVKGDKGDQGETGLNGHNVTHKYGYKEIYDWTCPVQEINPHLLTSSDDLASGGSVEKHMRETLNRINNLRKDGKKITEEGPCKCKCGNKVLYFIKNPLKEFFWWCSGADRPLLRMCPAEHSKYMGIGTVIFFTALMAMVSSFFAISYVFGNHELTANHEKFLVCVIFAIFWGLMIFFLDRFITNTMYSDGKVTISWPEFRSALPRILISIFLGIVISAPLELKIFEQEVTEHIINTRKESLKNTLASDTSALKCEYNIISAEIDRRKGNIKIIQEYRHEADSLGKVVKDAQNKAGNKEGMAQPVWNPNSDPNGSKHKKDIEAWRVNQRATNQVNQEAKEAAGSSDKQRINYLNDTIANLSAQLDTANLVIERNEINKRIKNYVKAFDLKIKDDSLKSYAKSTGLYERLAALHAIAFHEDRESDSSKYEPWSKESEKCRFWGFFSGILFLLIIVSLRFTANVTKQSNTKDSKDAKPIDKIISIGKIKLFIRGATICKIKLFCRGATVLWPWFAVVALICAYCNNALFNALPYYIFSSVGMIMMLFILIDVSPVFYKMMIADGQYEQYLHKEKSITQDLGRLNFAKSIAKVNESEIGRLAPLIFSKPFEKIKEILQGSKQKESLEWTKDENGDDIRISSQTIRESNEEVFTTVLGMKKAIIEASYQAWYRDMRDAIIGMHKPGGPNGGNATISDDPNDPNDPSARARRETGHHTSDDEPFDEENYYGRTTGTSPEYDASSDDPHPGTPEDYLNEEDTHLNNPTDDNILDTASDEDESDEDSSKNDSMNDSSNTEEEEEGNASESMDNTENTHPDADVESEVSDDDDDDDTINPK